MEYGFCGGANIETIGSTNDAAQTAGLVCLLAEGFHVSRYTGESVSPEKGGASVGGTGRVR